MDKKKHQSLLDLETLVVDTLNKMSSRSKDLPTQPLYKIEWLKADKPLKNNKGVETRNYKKLLFSLEESIVVEKDTDLVDKENKPIKKESIVKETTYLYEGIYFYDNKTFNNYKTLERAYKDFILNSIGLLAFQSYELKLENNEKQ